MFSKVKESNNLGVVEDGGIGGLQVASSNSKLEGTWNKLDEPLLCSLYCLICSWPGSRGSRTFLGANYWTLWGGRWISLIPEYEIHFSS